MKSLIVITVALFTTSGFSQTVNRCDTNFVGLGRGPYQCSRGSELLTALKLEIIKNLCIVKMDPICLEEVHSVDADSDCYSVLRNEQSSRKIDPRNKRSSVKTRFRIQMKNEADCLMSPERIAKIKNLKSKSAFAAWLNGDRYQLDSFDPKTIESQGSPIDLNDAVSTILTVAPTGIGQSANAAFQIGKLLFQPTHKDGALRTIEECGYSGMYMGAFKLSDGTCKTDFSLSNPAIKDLFRQSDETQSLAMKCGAACKYYETLLLTLMAANEFKMNFLGPIGITGAKCNKVAKTVQYSFKYPVKQVGSALSGREPDPAIPHVGFPSIQVVNRELARKVFCVGGNIDGGAVYAGGSKSSSIECMSMTVNARIDGPITRISTESDTNLNVEADPTANSRTTFAFDNFCRETDLECKPQGIDPEMIMKPLKSRPFYSTTALSSNGKDQNYDFSSYGRDVQRAAVLASSYLSACCKSRDFDKCAKSRYHSVSEERVYNFNKIIRATK